MKIMTTKHTEIEGIYTNQLLVNWTDCNAFGELQPSALLNFAQVTAGKHAEANGFGYSAMIKNKQAWVLQRIKLDIYNLPAWRSRIELETWIRDLRGSTSYREFQVSCNGEIIARINTFWVCINYARRRPEAPLVDLSGFKMYTKRFPDHPVAERIKIPPKCVLQHKLVVRFSDLDLLQHVNNTKYLSWVVDCLSHEEIRALSHCTIEMNFLAELQLEDEVWIERGCDPHRDHFLVTRAKDKSVVFLCKIRSKAIKCF